MATVAVPRADRGEPEWPVWATVLVGLAPGMLLQSWVLNRTETMTFGNASLAYPAGWVRTSERGGVAGAADLHRGGLFGPRVSLRQVPRDELVVGDAPLATAAGAWSVARAQELTAYRVLAVEPTRASGREAVRVEYAYLDPSPLGSASGAMPGLMRGYDTLVWNGDGYFVLSFAAESSDFARLTEPQFPRIRSVYQKISESWRIS